LRIFIFYLFDVDLKIFVSDGFMDLMIFMICCKKIVQFKSLSV